MRTADTIRIWTRSLAGVTGQLVTDDPHVRTLLDTDPGFAQEVSGLLNSVQPTLPVLPANLTSVGQLAVTYHAELVRHRPGHRNADARIRPLRSADRQPYGFGRKAVSADGPGGRLTGDAAGDVPALIPGRAIGGQVPQ